MTIYYDFYWPPIDFAAVAKLTVSLATNEEELLLNGTLSDNTTNQISFIKYGYSRSVSITSTTVDNSSITFVVKGLQNGVPVSEEITGGNVNTTVFGLLAFDVITSITATSDEFPPEFFFVGTGDVGYLPIISVNTAMNVGVVNYALQSVFSLPDNNTITYQLYKTLAKVPNLGRSYDDLIGNTTYLLTVGTTTDAPEIINSDFVTNYYLVNITASLDTDFLRIIYLQV